MRSTYELEQDIWRVTARRPVPTEGTGGAGPGGRAPGDGALEARPDSGPVRSVMGGPDPVDLVPLMAP